MIRNSKLKDCKKIMELIPKNFTDMKWPEILEYKIMIPIYILTNRCYVAEEDGIIIGAVCRGLYKNVIGWLCVDKEFRKLGIGNQLMRTAEKDLRKHKSEVKIGLYARTEQLISYYQNQGYILKGKSYMEKILLPIDPEVEKGLL